MEVSTQFAHQIYGRVKNEFYFVLDYYRTIHGTALLAKRHTVIFVRSVERLLRDDSGSGGNARLAVFAKAAGIDGARAADGDSSQFNARLMPRCVDVFLRKVYGAGTGPAGLQQGIGRFLRGSPPLAPLAEAVAAARLCLEGFGEPSLVARVESDLAESARVDPASLQRREAAFAPGQNKNSALVPSQIMAPSAVFVPSAIAAPTTFPSSASAPLVDVDRALLIVVEAFEIGDAYLARRRRCAARVFVKWLYRHRCRKCGDGASRPNTQPRDEAQAAAACVPEEAADVEEGGPLAEPPPAFSPWLDGPVAAGLLATPRARLAEALVRDTYFNSFPATALEVTLDLKLKKIGADELATPSRLAVPRRYTRVC